MEKKIIDYMMEQKVLTLATCKDGNPYCANCFYVFDHENKQLIFLSDMSTKHIVNALANKNVAGTIDKEVTTVAKIKGLQFTGKFIDPSEAQKEGFYQLYYEIRQELNHK